MRKTILAAAIMGLLIIPTLAGCSDESGAREAAEAQGLTNVVTHGHAFFGCDKHDNVTTKFEATSVNGKHVEGVVCSQLSPFGKMSTVRIKSAS